RWARDVAKLDGPTASLERVVARFGRALLITRGVPVPYQHSTRRRFNQFARMLPEQAPFRPTPP
ncbi:MAG: hypothetical protein AAF550_01475, partial [Myxococcota bacterium]